MTLCPYGHPMVPQVLTENAHKARGRLTLIAWTSHLPLGMEPPNLPRTLLLPHGNKPKLGSNNYLGPCMSTLLTVPGSTWGAVRRRIFFPYRPQTSLQCRTRGNFGLEQKPTTFHKLKRWGIHVFKDYPSWIQSVSVQNILFKTSSKARRRKEEFCLKWKPVNLLVADIHSSKETPEIISSSRHKLLNKRTEIIPVPSVFKF